MIRKYSISLLIIACFAAVCYAQTEPKKKKFSELPPVSDERADMTPEQYDKYRERKAKERRDAEIKRAKELKEEEDAARETTTKYGDGTGTEEEAAKQSQETGNQDVSAPVNNDLPISQEELEVARKEQEAARLREEQAKQAEEEAKAKAAKGDYSAMQKLAKEKEKADAAGPKNYSEVRMVDPPSADSLKKTGLPLPANIAMKYGNTGKDTASTMTMDRQDIFLPRKISDSLFIFMLRTTCGQKPCESYSLEIFFDGTVNYHGINNVERRGDYTGKVSKEVLKSFFDFAKDMKYYGLNDAYLAPDDNGKNPDKQYTYTIMQVKGKKKMVQDGHYETPSELIFFHKLIEESIADTQWSTMGKKKEKKKLSANNSNKKAARK